jgi:hypothetical protein
MPDDRDFNPATNELIEAAETGREFDTQRINSLIREMTKAQDIAAEKTKNMDEEISSIAKKQKEAAKMLGQADITDAQLSREMKGVVGSLGNAIGHFSRGIANVTKGTMETTTNAIKQYGKAISEDVALNKQNTITMALASASPLFGHFAAKFMETDVFKEAAGKIKSKVTGAISSGLSGVGRLFKRKEKEGPEMSAISEDLSDIKLKLEGVPELQKGGVVGRKGVAEVHPAEVVMPYQKVIQVATEAGEMKREERKGFYEKIMGIYEDFQDNVAAIQQEQMEAPWHEQLVNEMRQLRTGILGATNTWQEAIERTLTQHPTLMKMVTFANLMRSAIRSPIRYLFGVYGKYRARAQRAARSKNVFDRLSDLIILFYGTLMPKMDTLIKIGQEHLEYASGGRKKVEEITDVTGAKTRYEEIKDFLTGKRKKEKLEERASLSGLLSWIVGGEEGLDVEKMKEAGITGLGDILNPKKLFSAAKEIGITSRGKLGEFASQVEPTGMLGGILGRIIGGKEFVELQKKRAKEAAEPEQMELPFGMRKVEEQKKEERQKNTIVAAINEAASENKTLGSALNKTQELYEKSSEKTQNIMSGVKGAVEKNEAVKKSTDKINELTEVTKNKFDSVKESIESGEAAKKTTEKLDEVIKGTKDIVMSESKKKSYERIERSFGRFAKVFQENKALNKVRNQASEKANKVLSKISDSEKRQETIAKGQKKAAEAGAKASKTAAKYTKRSSRLLRKLNMKMMAKKISDIFMWGVSMLMSGLSFIGSKLMSGFLTVGIGLGRIALALGMAPFKMFGGTIGRGVGGMFAKGQVLRGVGTMAGRGLGVAAGAGMLAYGAVTGAMKADEWGTSKTAAGIGGALGGTGKGWGGAASGALKGATIGATIGSIVPGIGTAIGGAVGAIAGGIMGFVGGKNIAKGLDAMGGAIKKFAKAAWKFIKMPFTWAGGLIKRAWKAIKEKYKKEGIMGVIKIVAKNLLKLNPAYWLGKLIGNLLEKYFGWMREKLGTIPGIGKYFREQTKYEQLEEKMQEKHGGFFGLSEAQLRKKILADPEARAAFADALKEVPVDRATNTQRILADEMGIQLAPAMATAEAAAGLNKAVKEGMDKQQTIVNQTAVTTNNAVSSSVQSLATIASQLGGGSGPGTGFSSGNNFVADVASSNIN